MALQSSGAISISQIKSELGSSSNSLRGLSSAAGKSTPDAMSEFYGYTSLVTNSLSIGSFYRDGSEAYVQVLSQFAVSSTLTVGVQISDSCSGIYQTMFVTIYSGNTSGAAYSSGFGACGSIEASGSNISPASDGTYIYIFGAGFYGYYT